MREVITVKLRIISQSFPGIFKTEKLKADKIE